MNCKPGDMAVIAQSVDGVNVGKIVEVCSFQGTHSVFGPIWRVRSHAGELVTEYGAVGFSCDCADAWLRPIRGDGITDSEVSELFSPSPAKESEKV